MPRAGEGQEMNKWPCCGPITSGHNGHKSQPRGQLGRGIYVAEGTKIRTLLKVVKTILIELLDSRLLAESVVPKQG